MNALRDNFVLVIFIVLASTACAQRTVVTAQVKDSAWTLYVNCFYNIDFEGNLLQTSRYAYGGGDFQRRYVGEKCDSSGNLQIQLNDTIKGIVPGDGRWRLQIPSAKSYVAGNRYCFQATLVGTGEIQNVTTNLAAAAPVLPKASNSVPVLSSGGRVSTNGESSPAIGNCAMWTTGNVLSDLLCASGTLPMEVDNNIQGKSRGDCSAISNVPERSTLGPPRAGRLPGFRQNPVFDAQQDYGATGNGSTNDLAALQAAVDAADASGGGTVYLRKGSYNIGSGQWKIATSSAQHFISVVGEGPTVTKILSVDPTSAAIYLQHEKYVDMQGLAVNQVGTPHAGIGIAMGGDGGGGTQTNGSVLESVGVDNFNWCVSTSGRGGTSSEITFINLSLSHCTNGFRNADFNGLDFTFIQLQMSFNAIGINATTPGVNVFGGSSSFNGDDFVFGGNGENVIVGYRSEVATKTFATISAGRLSIINCLVEGMPTSNIHTAIAFNGGHLTVENSQLAGQIVVAGSLVGDGSISLKNNSIVDGLNTYSLTSQPTGQGPGFRFISGLNAGTRFESINNVQLTVNRSNVVGMIGQWPSGEGYILSKQGSSQTFAYLTGKSIGELLQVGVGIGVGANTIQPTAYVHHVGAGLIKSIDATGGTAGLNGNPLPFRCVQLIPDAAFTTDKTGNIAVALRAVIGQAITFCYDPVANKWYPSAPQPFLGVLRDHRFAYREYRCVYTVTGDQWFQRWHRAQKVRCSVRSMKISIALVDGTEDSRVLSAGNRATHSGGNISRLHSFSAALHLSQTRRIHIRGHIVPVGRIRSNRSSCPMAIVHLSS
ncbi:MAG: hypothetical protein ACRD23_09660 [Terriglobales bacterium]